MKNNWMGISLLFIWCLFMGVTAISIGFGAVFPSMNLIAKPFICPRGEMQLETQDYYPSPVETVTTLTWYCVDHTTGEKVELGLFPMSLYAGLIYGFLLFLVIYAGWKVWMYKLASQASPTHDSTTPKPNWERDLAEQIHQTNMEFENRGARTKSSLNALDRMKELKGMRDANLISEAEYEQKRAEILKEM
ncbi:MAG: hypothetical protein HKUEN02_01830 [Anaerolineaceae bacterium]|nr:MAG: hypothetical protein HKUEN02_01830 [Anaerolineaceae bacterium]